MKILTLFLALFLTFLPESTPNVFFSQGGQQEVCWEEADELEPISGTLFPSLYINPQNLPSSSFLKGSGSLADGFGCRSDSSPRRIQV